MNASGAVHEVVQPPVLARVRLIRKNSLRSDVKVCHIFCLKADLRSNVVSLRPMLAMINSRLSSPTMSAISERYAAENKKPRDTPSTENLHEGLIRVILQTIAYNIQNDTLITGIIIMGRSSCEFLPASITLERRPWSRSGYV